LFSRGLLEAFKHLLPVYWHQHSDRHCWSADGQCTLEHVKHQ